MNAYRKSFLPNASAAFGCMTDYAINASGFDGDVYMRMFIADGLAEQFERGNPRVIAGMSGYDMANKAITDATGKAPSAAPLSKTENRSPEYWAGWALCQYQWFSARSFSAILRSYPFSEIISSYYPLHEADITKFYAVAEAHYKAANPEPALKRLRETAGMTQAGLAKEAGVSLRSIQMYEQRRKDINKACVITVARIARILGCNIEELLESEEIY